MLRITQARLAVSTLALAIIVGASAATSAVRVPVRSTAAVATPAHAPLTVYGGRSLAQQRSATGGKLDAALAAIATRSADLGVGAAPSQLSSLNPAAHFMVSPGTGRSYVAVDAVTRGDPLALRDALVRLGLEHPAVFRNDVGGWLPLSAINAAAQLSELHSIRASMSRTHAGAVTTQGDNAQGSAAARSSGGVDGTGVTVGILSDSYNCYATYAANGVPASGNEGYASNGFVVTAAQDMTSGDLPAGTSIKVLEDAPCLSYDKTYVLPDADEGRAMMQVVHDVAPGASLAFHTATVTEADFATGITALASAGAKIIADDVTYFDEPYFQDGLVAQAVDSAKAAGVAYFSAAGNSGANGYDNTHPTFATASVTPANEMLMNFDATGVTTTTLMKVTVPALEPGQFIAVVLQWDQPYVTGTMPASAGATSQMDLCVSADGAGLVGSPQNPNDPNNGAVSNVGATQVCTGANNTGTDPYQILVIGYPASATPGPACAPAPNGNFTPTTCSAQQTLSIQVGLAGGTTPGRIKLTIDDNGAGVTYPGPILAGGGTLQGHPGAAGAMAVGAVWWDLTPACGQSPALLETFSAKGGDPILFDGPTGARLATPVTRQKPDIAGPDGGSNTFLGFKIGAGGSGACSDTGTHPDFFGTSAATPHVAAGAALLLQHNPSITTDALYATLKQSATPLANDTVNGGNNFTSGYGFVKFDTALTDEPTAPNITASLNPTTVDTGQSSTYMWSVTNATGCTASGAWSGTQPLSGSMPVTQSAAGMYDYTLTCVNANGQSIDTEVLTVVTSGGGGGGGGGGSLDLVALLALGGLAAGRVRRRRA